VRGFAEKAAALLVCFRGPELRARLEALRKEEHNALFALKERTLARVAPKPPKRDETGGIRKAFEARPSNVKRIPQYADLSI
jgi:hypothetical protein